MDTANITAGDSYLDDDKFAPDTLGEYFTTGKDEEGNATAIYNGKSQKPTITVAGAEALYGREDGETDDELLARVADKYTVTWQAGRYFDKDPDDETLGEAIPADKQGDYKEIVAGSHYYRIVDTTTGSVICYKHLYSIGQYEITGAITYDKETAEFVIGAVSFDPYIGFVDGKEHTWSTKNINGIAMGGEGVVKVGTLTPKVTLDYKDADGNPWIQSSSLAASDNTLSGSVGESGFWQYDGKAIDLNNNKISSELQYVAECYALPTTYETHSTNNTTITTYYGSLGEAIDATSSGTIYPMQSFTYSITLKDGETVKTGTPTVGTTLKTGDYTHILEGKTYTIGANVTLCIPYGTDYSKYFTKDELTNKDGNGDKNAFQNKDNLKNEVVIESLKDAQGNVVKDANGNVVPTLINKGTLQIPGVVSGGNGSAKYNSITAGDHSQITLGDYAVISNPTGTIQCYGFIAEKNYNKGSKVEMTGGSMDVVFSIVEHRGGTILSGMISDLQSTPFNRFYIQTVTSTLVVHEGATVSGFYDLHISLGHQYGKIGFFGNTSDVFFQFDPNDGAKKSQVTLKYDVENQQNQLDVYGSVNFNNISLSTSYGDISTANVFLPMSHYWKVQCNKFISGDAATVTALAQDIKILPGGSVTIAEGVTFKGRKIVIYSTTAPQIPDSDSASTYVYNTKADGTAVTATDGVLCVNGSLEVQYLGGPVQAGAEGATLKISSGVSVTSKEITGKYTDLTHLIIPGIYYNNTNPTVTASGDIAKGTSVNAKQPLSVGRQYKSSGSAWAYQRSITITYNVNDSTVAPVTGIAPKSETLWSNEGITLSGNYYPNPTRDYYTFNQWTIASDGSAASGKTVYSNTTLNANWNAITYKITFNYPAVAGFTLPTPPNMMEFTVEDTQDGMLTLSNPAAVGDYFFNGWYSDNAFENEITGGGYTVKLSALENLGTYNESTNERSMTLYGQWTNVSYTIRFDMNLQTNTTAESITPKTVGLAQSAQALPTIADLATNQYYHTGWMCGDVVVATYGQVIDLITEGKVTANDDGTYTIIAQWVMKDYKLIVSGNSEANKNAISTVGTFYFTKDVLDNGVTLSKLFSSFEVNKYDGDREVNKYFKSWLKGSEPIEIITSDNFGASNKELALTSSWGTKAKVTFDANTGNTGDNSLNITNPANPIYLMAGTCDISQIEEFSEAYAKLTTGDDDTDIKYYYKGLKLNGTALGEGVTSFTVTNDGTYAVTIDWGTKHEISIVINKGKIDTYSVTIGTEEITINATRWINPLDTLDVVATATAKKKGLTGLLGVYTATLVVDYKPNGTTVSYEIFEGKSQKTDTPTTWNSDDYIGKAYSGYTYDFEEGGVTTITITGSS